MGLKEEIKQTKPFANPGEEAFLNLLRTADLLTYEVSAFLKDNNLTVSQYNALRILRGAGAEGLPSCEVGARMLTRVPDFTRLLDRLERAGLVRRRRETSDRRVVRAWITEAGLALLAKLDQPLSDLHLRQMSLLDADQLRSLSNMLTALRQRD